MMMKFNVDYALKAMVWEEAKAKLRTLVRLQGSYEYPDIAEQEKFSMLHQEVEDFIQSIETNGLHE